MKKDRDYLYRKTYYIDYLYRKTYYIDYLYGKTDNLYRKADYID